MPLDVRSDIFLFGIILYEMIVKYPFRRESRVATVTAILQDEPKPLHELVPAVPWELERLITRCLRKSPERRLRSMADLAIALKELQGGIRFGTTLRSFVTPCADRTQADSRLESDCVRSHCIALCRDCLVDPRPTTCPIEI